MITSLQASAIRKKPETERTAEDSANLAEYVAAHPRGRPKGSVNKPKGESPPSPGLGDKQTSFDPASFVESATKEADESDFKQSPPAPGKEEIPHVKAEFVPESEKQKEKQEEKARKRKLAAIAAITYLNWLNNANAEIARESPILALSPEIIRDFVAPAAFAVAEKYSPDFELGDEIVVIAAAGYSLFARSKIRSMQKARESGAGAEEAPKAAIKQPLKIVQEEKPPVSETQPIDSGESWGSVSK